MHTYNTTFDINWKLVNLISAIERFDACWPAIERREGELLKEISVTDPVQIAADDLKLQKLLTQGLDNIEGFSFWYETDIDTPPVVKCAIFCVEHGTQLISALLRRHGYQWIKYIDLGRELENHKAKYVPPGQDINGWVLLFLTCLRNVQERLMQLLNIDGVKQNLSLKAQRLLHIIYANQGIKTSAIAKKLNVPALPQKGCWTI